MSKPTWIDESDGDEKDGEGEIWTDPSPDLLLRADRYQVQDVYERLDAGAPRGDEVAQAITSIRRLISPEALQHFALAAQAAGGKGHELPRDQGVLETLVDAVTVRTGVAEIYAITGAEEILRAVEEVDAVLDGATYRDAVLAIPEQEQWKLRESLIDAPSDHWWGRLAALRELGGFVARS